MPDVKLSPIQWFLVEMDRRLSGRVSEERKQELLREYASHLQLAKEEHLSTTKTEHEAESKAVKAFGSPSNLAYAEMGHPKFTKFGTILQILAFAPLAWVLYPAITAPTLPNNELILTTAYFCVFIFMAGCVLTRKLRIIPILATWIPIVVLSVSLMIWAHINGTRSDGALVKANEETRNEIATMELELAQVNQTRSKIKSVLEAAKQGTFSTFIQSQQSKDLLFPVRKDLNKLSSYPFVEAMNLIPNPRDPRVYQVRRALYLDLTGLQLGWTYDATYARDRWLADGQKWIETIDEQVKNSHVVSMIESRKDSLEDPGDVPFRIPITALLMWTPLWLISVALGAIAIKIEKWRLTRATDSDPWNKILRS